MVAAHRDVRIVARDLVGHLVPTEQSIAEGTYR